MQGKRQTQIRTGNEMLRKKEEERVGAGGGVVAALATSSLTRFSFSLSFSFLRTWHVIFSNRETISKRIKVKWNSAKTSIKTKLYYHHYTLAFLLSIPFFLFVTTSH